MLSALLACVSLHSEASPGGAVAVGDSALRDSAVGDSGERIEPGAELLFTGAQVSGLGVRDLRVRDGVIVEVGAALAVGGATPVSLTGRWLVPGFVDSHVHLAYLREGEAMLDGGVVAAVDLAAPVSFLAEDPGALRLLASGPMVTAVSGYPTTSWGRDGYGLEVSTVAEAEAAVDQLVAAGAGVIKLPLEGSTRLGDEVFAAAVARAHQSGKKVAVHALGDADAALAASLGADVLAHTPTEPLSESTVAAWSGKGVVSTLRAFGGGSSTLANLAALRAAGATVLYGTDFGNTRTAGVDPSEVLLLQSAGLSPADVVASATVSPATFWGLEGFGRLEVGSPASFLVLTADPLLTPEALALPEAVWVAGVAR